MEIRYCLSGLVVTGSGSLNPAMTLLPWAGHIMPCEDKRMLICTWFMSLSVVHESAITYPFVPLKSSEQEA